MKKYINPAPYKRTDALAKQIMTELAKKLYPASDTTIAGIIAALQNDIDRMQKGSRRDSKYSDLMPKDEVRDRLVVCFFSLVDALTDYPDATIQGAARAILKEVGHLRGAQDRDYAIESSDITTMLELLQKPGMTSELAKINLLGPLVTALDAAQADFDRAADAYYDIDAARRAGDIEMVSRIAKDMVRHINALADYLTIMVGIDPENYKTTADRIENRINRQNANIVAMRKNKPLPYPEDDAADNAGSAPEGTGDDSMPTA